MPRSLFLALLLLLRCAPSDAPTCEQGALGLEAGAKEGEGVAIAEIAPGGPADLAGIRRADVLLSVGGRETRYACEVAPLVFHRDCAPVAVVVRRGGETIETTLTPVDQHSFYEKSCSDGDPTACFRRAWMNEESYEDACERGSAEACAAYGFRLMSDRKPEAVAVLERACDRGSGAGCAHLAFLYAEGELVPKNEVRALDFYTRGCSYGDARSCYSMGVLYDDGRGTSTSASRAASAYEKSCDAGVSMACTDGGYLYERGLGTMKDLPRAAEMYRRGCEGSPCEPPNLRGCVNLGNAYRDGIGVAKDPVRAAGIFRDTCGRTSANPNEEQSRVRACVLFGAFEMNGIGVPRNVESGLARSMDGCERGDAVGCFNVASVYASRDQFPRAAELYDRSCEGGDAEACYELAVLYDEAKGVPYDRARSAVLFRRACGAGFTRACGR